MANARPLRRYKYTVEAEGYTYSGKLKYLQQCRSVLVAHPLNWEEFHSHMLRSSGPQQNYILTTKAWGDLDQQIGQLMQNPAEAERIANNSYAVFPERNLSPAAVRSLGLLLFAVQNSVTHVRRNRSRATSAA